MDFHSIHITIDPSRIAFLKFIIEGYDGLAVVTTVDRKAGCVRLIFPEARSNELHRLLESLLPGYSPAQSMAT